MSFVVAVVPSGRMECSSTCFASHEASCTPHCIVPAPVGRSCFQARTEQKLRLICTDKSETSQLQCSPDKKVSVGLQWKIGGPLRRRLGSSGQRTAGGEKAATLDAV